MSTYFLATPLVKKKSPSADMAGEDQEKSKVDPSNIIGIEYGDVPDNKCQALEAYVKEQQIADLARCGRKGSIHLPTHPSTTTTTQQAV